MRYLAPLVPWLLCASNDHLPKMSIPCGVWRDHSWFHWGLAASSALSLQLSRYSLYSIVLMLLFLLGAHIYTSPSSLEFFSGTLFSQSVFTSHSLYHLWTLHIPLEGHLFSELYLYVLSVKDSLHMFHSICIKLQIMYWHLHFVKDDWNWDSSFFFFKCPYKIRENFFCLAQDLKLGKFKTWHPV